MRIATVFVWGLFALTLSAQVIETRPLRSGADRERFRALRNRLSHTTISVDWKAKPLAECLDELRSRVNLNFVIAAAARDQVEEEVDMKLHHVPAWIVLALLRDRHQLGFLNDRGIIVVTTRDDMFRRSFTTKIYNAFTIGYKLPDFPGPRLGLRPSGAEIGEEEAEDEVEPHDPQETIDLVKRMTGESLWEIEGASIEVLRGIVVVRHAPSVQRQVESLLYRLGALM